jgi:hypothetical protein
MKCVKELSDAACTPDPAAEIAELGKKYAAEFKKGTEHTADAGTLGQACRALADGETPARPPTVE